MGMIGQRNALRVEDQIGKESIRLSGESFVFRTRYPKVLIKTSRLFFSGSQNSSVLKTYTNVGKVITTVRTVVTIKKCRCSRIRARMEEPRYRSHNISNSKHSLEH